MALTLYSEDGRYNQEFLGNYALINIKDRGQIFRVEVDTIEHIEAAGDYMCIYTGDNSLILSETMKDLERRLDQRAAGGGIGQRRLRQSLEHSGS